MNPLLDPNLFYSGPKVESLLEAQRAENEARMAECRKEAQERTEKGIRDYFAFKSSMHPAQIQDLINELRRMAEGEK